MASFTKNNRLCKKADFKSVFLHAKKITYQHFILLYKPNILSGARIGIILPKKYIRLSAKRNRIKRLIRESFRHHSVKNLQLDLVVILRRSVPKDDDNLFKHVINQLLTRLQQQIT